MVRRTTASCGLTAAQTRVMRWLSQGWSAEAANGSSVHVNGSRICNVDTVATLEQRGLVEPDGPHCWRATAAGRALRDSVCD